MNFKVYELDPENLPQGVVLGIQRTAGGAEYRLVGHIQFDSEDIDKYCVIDGNGDYLSPVTHYCILEQTQSYYHKLCELLEDKVWDQDLELNCKNLIEKFDNTNAALGVLIEMFHFYRDSVAFGSEGTDNWMRQSTAETRRNVFMGHIKKQNDGIAMNRIPFRIKSN